MSLPRVLAVVAAIALLVAPPGSAGSADRIVGPYAQSDVFWTWDSALLLHVGVSPWNETAGYVRSTPYLIDCPNACTRPLGFGATVELTAYASPGMQFTGWSGDACAGQGNPCRLTMAGDTIVTAEFAGRYRAPEPPVSGATPVRQHRLTVVPTTLSLVHSSPGGIAGCTAWPPPGGSGTCSALFDEGTTVVVTDATVGCPFVTWSGDGTTVGPNDREVVMDADKTVQPYIPVC